MYHVMTDNLTCIKMISQLAEFPNYISDNVIHRFQWYFNEDITYIRI